VFKFKHFLFIYFCFFVHQQAFTQKDPSKHLAESITVSALKKHISTLASDEMEGRENGKKGQKKAAAYIMQQLVNAGISPIMGTYFQDVPFIEIVPEQIKIFINGKPLSYIKDFEHYKDFDNATIQQAECLFVAFGSKKSFAVADKNFTVKDKIIFIAGGSEKKNIPSISKRVEYAHDLEAKAVFIIQDSGEFSSDSSYLMEREQALVRDFSNPIPVFFIAQNYADSLFQSTDFSLKKWLKKSKPRHLDLILDIEVKMVNDSQKGENVLAFIPGTELKNEIVILLAHYDHLGVKGNEVFNGADDNATGTAALIEIAKTLQLAKSKGSGFKRSVLFILTTGEEKGLLGSKYYVQNPLFSPEQTFAVLNVDMIGRSDEKHQSNPKYIYLVGANFISPVLQEICETQNDKYTNLALDYTYNSKDHPERFYYRSDHYPFARQGVPSVFYFSGIHNDYHQNTDTVEKINFEKVQLVTRFIFHTAWDLLNTERSLIPKKP
jgi:hypothetical protein